MPLSRANPPVATTIERRPTTLSASAARLLANGPMDVVTLMQCVCRVDHLREEAARRMADALFASHPEFRRLPSGHWALTVDGAVVAGWPEGAVRAVAGSADVQVDPSRVARRSLTDVAFAVVDVETTGTRAGTRDRVTEIAIVDVRDGAVGEVFSQLVNPERPIPMHITALTQISWAMVKDEPTFRQIANAVSTRLAGRVFTAHNAAFDWRFVSEELSRGSGVQLGGPRLCTVRMARALLPQLSRRSLDHVTNYFGIRVSARHRAGGDAVATAEVLVRLLHVAADRGLDSWEALTAHLAAPRHRRSNTAANRRRRSFPSPVREDHSA